MMRIAVTVVLALAVGTVVLAARSHRGRAPASAPAKMFNGLPLVTKSGPIAEPPPPPYRGTEISPHPDARGDELVFQQAFCRRMAELDPRYQHRKIHGPWMHAKGLRLIGWWGQVESVTPAAGGGIDVRVSISPLTVGASVLTDNEETYHVSVDGITLIGHTGTAVPHFVSRP